MYDMKLHEILVITPKLRVIRVPGGWLYERVIKRLSDADNDVIHTFVPYNEEFNEQRSLST